MVSRVREGGQSQRSSNILRKQARRCANCYVIDRNSPNGHRGQVVKDTVDWHRQKEPREETIKLKSISQIEVIRQLREF